MSNVFLKNTTASAITVAGFTVHHIDSTDAEIVEVVRIADDARFHAFKYALNGTPYYYVVDGINTEWTDDIYSIGYGFKMAVSGVVSSTSADDIKIFDNYPIFGGVVDVYTE